MKVQKRQEKRLTKKRKKFRSWKKKYVIVLEKKENWKARLKHTAAWKNSTIPNIRKN